MPSNYNAIPEPNITPEGLLASVQALKQAVEQLTGQRNPDARALTPEDQLDLASVAYTGILADNSITTAMIQDMAVLYAKIQNVSATSRILGRRTAGAGVIEECTLSQILDFVGSAADGDILYRSAGAWTRLPIGSNTNVLTLASGLPSWAAVPAAGGMTLISSASFPAAATWNFTNLGGYKMFAVGVRGVSQASGTSRVLQCALSGNNGSSYGTARQPSFGTSFVSGGTVYGLFWVTRVDQTNNQLVGISTMATPAAATVLESGSLGPINAMQFSWSGAATNFTAGDIDVYGIK